jgi:hypothetical protein
LRGQEFREGRLKLPLLKVIRTRDEIVVVVCDRELLGKTFKRKNMKLEVKASFYGGRETSVKECIAAIKNATIANLVGSIVERAVEEGLIEEKGVIRFQKVPHAQLVKM